LYQTRSNGFTAGVIRPREAGLAILPFRPQLERVQPHYRFGIPQRNRCRIRIAAVDEQLHRRFLSGADQPGIVGRNHDAEQDLVAVDFPLDRFVVVRIPNDLEIARASKLLNDLPALGSLIGVVDHHGNLVHIEAQRDAEQQQHQDRHGQSHSQTAFIAQNMAAFLASDSDGAA
jgi:hypothetical protein